MGELISTFHDTLALLDGYVSDNYTDDESTDSTIQEIVFRRSEEEEEEEDFNDFDVLCANMVEGDVESHDLVYRVDVLQKQIEDVCHTTIINNITNEEITFIGSRFVSLRNFITKANLSQFSDHYEDIFEILHLDHPDIPTIVEDMMPPMKMQLHRESLKETIIGPQEQPKESSHEDNDSGDSTSSSNSFPSLDQLKDHLLRINDHLAEVIKFFIEISTIKEEITTAINIVKAMFINFDEYHFHDFILENKEDIDNNSILRELLPCFEGAISQRKEAFDEMNSLVSSFSIAIEEEERKNKSLEDELEESRLTIINLKKELEMSITHTCDISKANKEAPIIKNMNSQGHKLIKQTQIMNENVIKQNSPQSSPNRKAVFNHAAMQEKVIQMHPNILFLQQQIASLQQANSQLQQQNSYLVSKKVSLEDVIQYIKETDLIGITNVGKQVLVDIIINAHRIPTARRYAKETKEVGFVLHSKSANCYSTMRNYLPLPSYNTIKEEFERDEIKAEKSVLDFTKISSLLDDYYKIHCIGRNEVRMTLAVDAISLTPSNKQELKTSLGALSHTIDKQYAFAKNTMTPEQREEFEKVENTPAGSINSAFIFYLEPHDPSLPCTPVHVFLKHGGAANKSVQALVNRVMEEIDRKEHFKVTNFASDGNLGHQAIYDKSFKEILALSKDLNLKEILESEEIHKLTNVGTTDLLHAYKVLRIRYLLNNINIIPSNTNHIVSNEVIKGCFKEGRELTDFTPVGKMRDIYAIDFFSFENLANLILANEYSAVLIIMPFVCFVNATTNSALSIRTAIKLLEIAYEFIVRFLFIMTIPHKNWKKTEQRRSKNADFLTVLPCSLLRRLVPTLVTLIYNLKTYVRVNIDNDTEGLPESVVQTFKEMKDFGIERLTSHPEENYNGFLREVARSQDKAATIMRIIGRANITKNFLIKHEVNVTNSYL